MYLIAGPNESTRRRPLPVSVSVRLPASPPSFSEIASTSFGTFMFDELIASDAESPSVIACSTEPPMVPGRRYESSLWLYVVDDGSFSAFCFAFEKFSCVSC